MRTEADRWVGALFHGWVELLTLFVMLFIALAIIGWCWNRGFRPADRGPLVSTALLAVCYASVLLLRHFRDDLVAASIIAVGVLLAGLASRSMHPQGLWIPAMLLAALFGLGFNLSAAVLTLVIALAAIFSARSGR
jgi:hypothetical protein